MNKTYKLTVIEDDNKKLTFDSESDGFNALEVLGILERKKQDIMNQMNGHIKPDTIKRKIIEDD